LAKSDSRHTISEVCQTKYTVQGM